MPSEFEYFAASPHPDDAGAFASDGEVDLIGLVDLTGSDGADGIPGQSYSSPPAGYGVDGLRGGDATESRPGQAAASLLCRLSYEQDDPDASRIRLTGKLSDATRTGADVDQSYVIGQAGYLFINVAGGKGGNGGRAGDGQPGSAGARGRDATRFSNGTDGGDGGAGGDAGSPSDGASGGDAGDVTLQVRQSDLGLLMLIKGNLSGGDIGFAGEPGIGGKGGPGGPGGRGYHWTTTSTFTDSKGNTQTRTHHHYNPGGSDGRSGRNGYPSSYRAKDGQPGSAGRLRIVVANQDGSTAEYRAPYDLQLVDFDVAGESDVFEPDSLISIDNIVIRNTGGMPTPENYLIRIYHPSDDWLFSDGVDLILPRSLAPDETHIFNNQGLRLRLGDQVADSPRRRSFRLHQSISPRASMESGIGRPFRQFENSQQIKLQFPVELLAITSLNSIAPGESTRVIWGVTNVSEETFDQKYLYRAIQSSIRLIGGDIALEHLAFFDTDDDPFDLQSRAFTKRIQELRPGQTQFFETRIGVKPHASVVAYQGFSLGVGLDLQRPKSSAESDKYRCVDYRQTLIRVAERYLREQGSRFLLIANEKTTVNDIDKWSQLADYFGSGLDVWDVSYYGFFDLIRDVDQDQSLLQQWRGMTIIVPNNYYQTPSGKTVAFQQLAKTQFVRAAADYDISFYIVGDSRTGGEELLQQSLIPIDDGKSPSQLKTQSEFLRAVGRWNKFIQRNQQVVGASVSSADQFADVALGAVHEFEINRRTLLFQPKEKWLTDQAKRLSEKLQRDDPLHRWVIVHRYDPGNTDTSWGFFRKRKVGKLEARRTLDATKGSAVLFEVDGIDAIDRDFINSEANKHGMFLALRFEDKVDRFIRLVGERVFPRFKERYVDRPLTDDEVQQIGSALVNSIIADIYNEQNVAREAKIWGPSGIRALTPKLNYLAERSLNYGVTMDQMEKNQVNMQLLYDLVAGIRYISEQTTTVWDSPLVPTSIFKRSRAVSHHMRNRCDRIVTSIFGRRLTWWDKATGPNDDYNPFGGRRSAKPRGIQRQIADQEISKRLELMRKEKTPLDHFTTAQTFPGLTYDPELLGKPSRVMSGTEYDLYVKAEAITTRNRYETERAIKAKRADLLVPMSKTDTITTDTPSATTTGKTSS